jgi:hypothetical protein
MVGPFFVCLWVQIFRCQEELVAQFGGFGRLRVVFLLIEMFRPQTALHDRVCQRRAIRKLHECKLDDIKSLRAVVLHWSNYMPYNREMAYL